MYKSNIPSKINRCVLWVVKTLVFTLLLLPATHARLHTHDATLGNTSHMERSPFKYFLTCSYYVRFSTIYILTTIRNISVLHFTYSCTLLTHCTLVHCYMSILMSTKCLLMWNNLKCMPRVNVCYMSILMSAKCLIMWNNWKCTPRVYVCYMSIFNVD